jgi:hypothetical protein
MASGTPDEPPPEMRVPDAPAVGKVTEQGMRLFESKRRSESRKADEAGIAMEKTDLALGRTAAAKSDAE